MKVRDWVMGGLVMSQLIACGGSARSGKGDDGGRGAGGSSGAMSAGSTSGGMGGTGGSAPTGGTGGTPPNPLCDAFAEDFVMECPQNGTFGDARWLCQEGFDEYTPLGCESEYGELIVCVTGATFDCLTGTVSDCEALADAVESCAN